MVYVSSSCLRDDKIINVIRSLKSSGINDIELSGGTKPYPQILDDLRYAKEELGVNLVLHNYFPPPAVDFVLNLASLNPEIYNQSMEHCKRSIDYSSKLGIDKFGFHAGFFIDIKVAEIGKRLTAVTLRDKEACYDQFCRAHNELSQLAGNDVKLFVENNVFSKSNHESFKGINPLMLTDLEAYNDLSTRLKFNLLLDVAHLKVSTKTLGKSFDNELVALFAKSDYIHVSDNDGLHDTNNGLLRNSELYHQLEQLNWSQKTVTIEVYDKLELVLDSLNNIKLIINA